MKVPGALGGRLLDPGAAVRPRAAGSRGRALVWVMVRLTGLLLSVLVLGHFAITHIVTDVANTGASFVARRWSSGVWLAWDWLMLAAALAHGTAGIWVAIEDYTPSPAARRRRQSALLALATVLFVLGTITIARVVLG